MSRGQPRQFNLIAAVLLIAISLAVLAPGISLSLTDRDEACYGQVIREMRSTGDWMVPHYLGKVWLGKPPMFYWLAGLSTSLCGWGEWQLRLVPVLASVINVLLIAWFADQLFNRRVGTWAGLIFITLGMATSLGKMLMTDALLLTFVLAAIILEWQMCTVGVTHARAALHGAALGCGVLTKGPVIVIFCGAFLIALLVAYRDRWRSWLGDWRWWAWGGGLAMGVAAPWYVYIYRVAPDAFITQFIAYEMTSRIASRTQGALPGFPGLYLLAAVVCLLPWSACIPGALRDAVGRRKEPAYLLLLIWLCVPWVFLELLRGKVYSYTLPCYVPLAMLLAAQLVRWFENTSASGASGQADAGCSKPGRWAFRLVCLPMLLGGILALLVGVLNLHRSWGWAAVVLGGVIATGFSIAFCLLEKRRLHAGCIAVLGATVAMHATLGLVFNPAVASSGFSRCVADAINAELRPGDRVAVCGYDESALFFYSLEPIETVAPAALSGFLASIRGGSPVLVAIDEGDFADLDRASSTLLRAHFVREVTGYSHIKKIRWEHDGRELAVRPERMYLARFGPGTASSAASPELPAEQEHRRNSRGTRPAAPRDRDDGG